MIQLIVTGRKMRATVTEPITTGSVGMPVEVELSNEFDGLVAWLVFDAGYKSADIALTGEPVTVPPQVLRVAGAELKVGVYGAKPDGTIVIPTVWTSCGTVQQGAEPSGFVPGDPAPSWPAQVQAIAMEALEVAQGVGGRVTSLDETELAYRTVDAVGIPTYVSDVSEYSEYGITETGWYCFVRIKSKDGAKVTSATTVEGAAGTIVTVGADHVDVAVRFEVAALSQTVTVTWTDGNTETFVMAAPDLAVRNMDYRTTFYVYDISDFVTWEYAAATGNVIRNKAYFELVDGEYVPVELVIGDAIPEGTYQHSKVIFEAMARNVTYQMPDIIDCPIEFKLPDVPDDGYGAWFEVQMRYQATYSMTLSPESSDVKAATDATQSQTAGVNIIDLHYADVAGAKLWRMVNTHSNYTEKLVPEALEFRVAPTKTAYAVGENLAVDGAEVIVTYADGARQKLATNATGLTFAPANGAALTADVTELVASYVLNDTTVTASTPITVE